MGSRLLWDIDLREMRLRVQLQGAWGTVGSRVKEQICIPVPTGGGLGHGLLTKRMSWIGGPFH